VAEFLTDLFHEGLQYRTIAGYRSMLSSVVTPIDNKPVGQHPYIIRLLKGVFNSRPPVSKIVPEWELPFVLQVLKECPFEPMSKAKLKYVTWKTVFLIAVTTFRRCSDIQSLTLGEENVSIQRKGVTFVRKGLCKQDRLNHTSPHIFIPSFSNSKLLDPKRALAIYLKKTEKYRMNKGKEELKLFLSYVKPHNAVSTQTISKWIVKLIKLAYKQINSDIKVKGHSTRAIAPSWALYKGLSLKTIMKAADWAKESTFTKFYLRNPNVNFLE
jgi:integrase